MNTFKIQLSKPRIILFYGVAFFCFLFLLFYIYTIRQACLLIDVESFETINLSFFMMFLVLPGFPILTLLVSIWQFQKFRVPNNRFEIEFPKSIITGGHVSSNALALQTKTSHYELSSFFISNYDELQKLFPEPFSYNHWHRYKSKFRWFKAVVFLLSLLTFFSWMSSMGGGGKYDLKYYLPFVKKIETVEVKGKLKEPIKLSYYEKTETCLGTNLYFENSNLRFEYLGGHDLNDEVLNDFGLKMLPIGTEVTLKIRTRDSIFLKKRLLTGEGKIRFYELKIEEDVLLRKRGLK